eukprot:tig00000388_g24818.t1
MEAAPQQWDSVDGGDPRLARNVGILRACRALRMAIIGQSILVIYFTNVVGLDLEGVYLVKTINSLIVIVSQLPAGLLSDRIGRKLALLLANVALLLAYAAYALATSFVHLVVGTTVLGLGFSLWASTEAAFLYETLQAMGTDVDKDALRKEAHTLSLTQLAESAAAVVGGEIGARVGLRPCMIATCAPFAVNLLLILLLVDPRKASRASGPLLRPARIPLRETARRAALLLSPRRDLLMPFLSSSLINAGTFTALWLHQVLVRRPVLPAVGPAPAPLSRRPVAPRRAPLHLFGWAWAILNIGVSAGAVAAPKLRRALGVRWTLFLAAALFGGTFATIGYIGPAWGIVASGAVLSTSRGIAQPVLATHINHRTQRGDRATINALSFVVMRAVFSAAGPATGSIAATLDLERACLAAGASLGGLAALLVLLTPPAGSAASALEADARSDEEREADEERLPLLAALRGAPTKAPAAPAAPPPALRREP